MDTMSDGIEITIRPARYREIRKIRVIEETAQRMFLDSDHPEAADLDPIPLARLCWQVRAGWLLVAADAHDQPVGFAACSLIDGDVFVEEVDVLPAFAGHRIGARLLDAVAATSASRSFERVVLTTFRDVPWNAPYYRRLGFHILQPEGWGPELVDWIEEENESGLDRASRVCLVRDVAD